MSQHAISTPTEIDMLVGFSDLTLYNRYTQKTGNLDLLALMTAYFELRAPLKIPTRNFDRVESRYQDIWIRGM